MATKDKLKSALPSAIVTTTKVSAVQKVGKPPKVSKDAIVMVKPFKPKGKRK